MSCFARDKTLDQIAVERTPPANTGFVVVDEPRQLEAAQASVAGLISEAARIASMEDAHILIATSEDLPTVQRSLENVEHTLLVFDGRMIMKKIAYAADRPDSSSPLEAIAIIRTLLRKGDFPVSKTYRSFPNTGEVILNERRLQPICG